MARGHPPVRLSPPLDCPGCVHLPPPPQAPSLPDRSLPFSYPAPSPPPAGRALLAPPSERTPTWVLSGPHWRVVLRSLAVAGLLSVPSEPGPSQRRRTGALAFGRPPQLSSGCGGLTPLPASSSAPCLGPRLPPSQTWAILAPSHSGLGARVQACKQRGCRKDTVGCSTRSRGTDHPRLTPTPPPVPGNRRPAVAPAPSPPPCTEVPVWVHPPRGHARAHGRRATEPALDRTPAESHGLGHGGRAARCPVGR